MASFFSVKKKIFGRDKSQVTQEAAEQGASTIIEATNATDLSEPREVLEETAQPDLSPPRMIARTDRGRFVMEKVYTH